MAVSPVRSGNVFEETIEHLLRMLHLGQFAPGDKLPPERELAESLRVSRTTLRDALAELQAAGYLLVRRGRYGGTYVAEVPPAPDVRERPPPTAAGVDDVLTVRMVVETAAAGLAAARQPTAEQCRVLRESHQVVAAESVVEDNVGRYRPLDSRFHLEIAELSGSPSLVSVVAEVRSRVNDLLDRIPLLAPNLRHSCEQHQKILDAIVAGDSAAAEQAMRDHLEGTAWLLRGFLT